MATEFDTDGEPFPLDGVALRPGPATDCLPDDPLAPSIVAYEAFLCAMAELTLEASPDELRVLLAIAERLNVGRKEYGALNIAADPRDFIKELKEELLDAAVYGAILTLGKET